MANPFKFAQEVRAEARKVTWPTRNETLVTTVMVFILAVLASIFFFGSFLASAFFCHSMTTFIH